MSDFKRWLCDACGYIYDEEKGDPDSGLSPGTRYEDIPDDWMCPLCGLTKSDLRPLPEQPQQSVASKAPPKASGKFVKAKLSKGSDNHVVIIGAGIAGWTVAEKLKQQNPQTPVLIVTACQGNYYSKPSLSTALSRHKQADDLIENNAEGKAEQLGIDIRTETRVLKIDSSRKKITTAKGPIVYDKLVLATGAHQRELPITGDAKDEILRINDLSSYKKFRTKLEQKVKHVTILGAGLIGCEFAEDLSSANYQVTLVDPSTQPMPTLLTDNIAARLQGVFQQKGINWLLGHRVEVVEKGGKHLRVTLDSGDVIETDMVISAAGLVANTTIAEKANIPINLGILVDRHMRTSVTDIYAIGDCAEVEGHIFAYIEPILRQAETIAADINGIDQAFIPRSPLIRVKTPSLPLAVCPPGTQVEASSVTENSSDELTEFMLNDALIGFVACGEQAKESLNLYKKMRVLA